MTHLLCTRRFYARVGAALCLCFVSAACAAQQSAKFPTGEYAGTVGGSPIRMTLRRQGSQVTGTYSYVRAGVTLRLEGAWQEGRARMREIYGARTQTGVLTARVREDGGLAGTWARPDGSGTLSFQAHPLGGARRENVERGRDPEQRDPQGPVRREALPTGLRSPDAPTVQRRSRPAPDTQPAPASREAGAKLLQAVRQGDTTAARRLLERGAPLDARDTRGRTALMLACSFSSDGTGSVSFASLEDRIEFVKFLLARGADVNARSEQEYTPVMYATASWGAGNPLLRMLLNANADVNARNVYGGTALMMAASKYGDVSTVQLLIGAGASVNLRDKAGHSALWDARSHHAPTSVRVLMDAGAVE